MIIEPVLDERMLHLSDITFSLTHPRSFIQPDSAGQDKSHIHDRYEIYVHVSGDVSFLVNNKLYPVKRGDVIVTGPGDVHVCVINQPCAHDHFCLWIRESGDGVLHRDALGENFHGRYSFSPDVGETVLQLLYQMEAGIAEGFDLAVAAHMLQLFLILSQKREAAAPATKLVPDEMQEIIDYINENYLHIGSIRELASRFGISTATLNRWFRRYLQISPNELVKVNRIAYAKRLLDMGATVTESCMRSGFSDSSYFISVFKKKFGVTPLRYQQRGR